MGTNGSGMKSRVIIIMGSRQDLDHCNEIAKHLESFGVQHIFRVASAHKTPEKVLRILESCEKERAVYITVAGRSNALSASVDANTAKPVIACPVYSEKYGGADLFSSLRVPSGIGSVTVIEPEAAAIAAVKILALNDEALERKIREYQSTKRRQIEEADKSVSKLE